VTAEAGQPPRFVDPRRVRRGFARAASGYDEHAAIEREIGKRMLERLDYVTIQPQRVLDLGCGSGAALTALRQRYRDAQVIGVDFCPEMLAAGREQATRLRRLLPFLTSTTAPRVAADAAALPFAAASAQLLWSNLMLLWADDPVAVIGEMHRVLDVGGLAMFTTLGPDTLKELRSAFGDGHTRTQRFIDMHDIGDMLVHAGFADPVMDMEVLTLTYADVDALIGDLRASGATCAAHDRPRGLSGRGTWQAMRAAYELMRRDGRLPATLEVVYGHAWKVAPKKDSQGRAVIRFERAGRR
jgi:malonyl-CoA O-methyltransferase